MSILGLNFIGIAWMSLSRAEIIWPAVMLPIASSISALACGSVPSGDVAGLAEEGVSTGLGRGFGSGFGSGLGSGLTIDLGAGLTVLAAGSMPFGINISSSLLRHFFKAKNIAIITIIASRKNLLLPFRALFLRYGL